MNIPEFTSPFQGNENLYSFKSGDIVYPVMDAFVYNTGDPYAHASWISLENIFYLKLLHPLSKYDFNLKFRIYIVSVIS